MNIYTYILNETTNLTAQDIADMEIPGWDLNRIQGMCSNDTGITLAIERDTEDMYWEELYLTGGLDGLAVIPLSGHQWTCQPECSDGFPTALYDYVVESVRGRRSLSTGGYSSRPADYEWRVMTKWAGALGYRIHYLGLAGQMQGDWLDVIVMVRGDHDPRVDDCLEEEMSDYWSGDVYRVQVDTEDGEYDDPVGRIMGDDGLEVVIREMIGTTLDGMSHDIIQAKKIAQEA